MTDKRRTGLRCALAVLLAAPVAVLALPAAPAVARSCDDLTAVVTSTSEDRTDALVTLPAELTGSPVPASAFTLTQDGLDVPVLAFTPGSAAATDVVVVLDTSARSAPVAAAAQDAASAVLRALPPTSSAGLVTAGGTPTVVHDLDPRPRAALPAVRATSPAGPAALVDAVLLAVRTLPLDPDRQQHVVVVGTGPDESSVARWQSVSSLVARRGVALDVLDLGSSPSLPAAGAQCPGAVPVDSAAAEGTALGEQIADRRRMVLPVVGEQSPVQVVLAYGDTSSTTVLTRRDDPDIAEPPTTRRDEAPGQLGVGTLVLAFVVGLLGLGALLVAVAARSHRGASARDAVHDLVGAAAAGFGQRGVPDHARKVPRAEARRRRADAWQDLSAALGGAPTARAVAEEAAREEQTVRAAAAEHQAVLRERAAAKDRAAERHLRALRRAELLAAEDRALRDTLALHGATLPDSSGPLADAERAQLAAVVEANRVLASVRAAAEEATERRRAAELAADEAAARAALEQEAAAAAQQDRLAAEQAAADAAQRADREQQGAGEASEARRVAEAEARQAEWLAAMERAAAAQALARREQAEAQAAAAESAQELAAERERAARESAEAAEDARLAAAARLEEQRLALETELVARQSVQEEAARQAATREVLQQQAAHEQAAREAAEREQAATNAALEQAARETAAREAELETAARQTAAREAALEQVARETAAREAALEEAARETAAREAALVESARGTAAREAALEQAAREQAAREAALEQAAREQAAREAALEQAAREQAARQAALEQAAQEQAARQAALEQAAQEQAAREAALEQAAREAALSQAAREAALEQAARDLAAQQAGAEAARGVDVRPVEPVTQRTVASGSGVAAAADVRSRRLHVVARALAEAEDDRDDVEGRDALEDRDGGEPPQPVAPVPDLPPPPAAGSDDDGAPDVILPEWEWADDDPDIAAARAAAHKRRRVPAVPVVRVLATLFVPAVVVARTVLQGDWWAGAGAVGVVLIVAAAVLTVLGVRWIWAATAEPFTLLRRTSRKIAEEQARLAEQSVAAAEVLTAVRGRRADDATWELFEERTGLAVPGSTRSAIDPKMDPLALVRYLAARQQGLQAPQSLLTVTLVPTLTCLVPAALLLMSI